MHEELFLGNPPKIPIVGISQDFFFMHGACDKNNRTMRAADVHSKDKWCECY